MLNHQQISMELHRTATFTFKGIFMINVIVMNTKEINSHLSL